MSTMNIAMCGSNRDFSRKKSGGGGGMWGFGTNENGGAVIPKNINIQVFPGTITQEILQYLFD